MRTDLAYHDRDELDIKLDDSSEIGDISRPLPAWSRLLNSTAFRRLAVIVVLGVLWQTASAALDNPLMFPSFIETVQAFLHDTLNGILPARVFASVRVLIIGYAIGLSLAAALTTLAVVTRVGADVLSTLTAMFNPLPAVAMLPLALLWFGLGTPSIVFVIANSVVWAVALNTHAGFQSVSDSLRMTGQNYGLRGARFVWFILVPAAFPSILTGLRIGWAFGWRTLIGAELVFGTISRSGGLGWYIFENRTQLETANVFAGLLAVILIGVVIESLIFRAIENLTIRRWGM